MITIVIFYGIKITLSYDDHKPPCFQAEYNGFKASIEILTGRVISGYMGSKQLRLILAWLELSKDEMMENWELAKENRPLNSIQPIRR